MFIIRYNVCPQNGPGGILKNYMFYHRIKGVIQINNQSGNDNILSRLEKEANKLMDQIA